MVTLIGNTYSHDQTTMCSRIRIEMLSLRYLHDLDDTQGPEAEATRALLRTQEFLIPWTYLECSNYDHSFFLAVRQVLYQTKTDNAAQ